jgi:hypothetical protein
MRRLATLWLPDQRASSRSDTRPCPLGRSLTVTVHAEEEEE